MAQAHRCFVYQIPRLVKKLKVPPHDYAVDYHHCYKAHTKTCRNRHQWRGIHRFRPSIIRVGDGRGYLVIGPTTHPRDILSVPLILIWSCQCSTPITLKQARHQVIRVGQTKAILGLTWGL